MALRAAGEAGHEHRCPLQALGRMHGCQLDRVGLTDLAGFQPELLGFGGSEVGEECTERRLLRVTRERGRSVGECVEVSPGGSRIDTGRATPPRCRARAFARPR